MDDYRVAWMALEKHWAITPNRDRIRGDKSYGMLRWTFALLLRMGFRLRIIGLENVPRTGPVIMAANHLSHVDPLIIIVSSRRKTHYLAKDGHFRNRFLAACMHATGQIETNRELGGNAALSSAAVALHANRALGIFPEGTRSKRVEPPFLLPGKSGVARLAASYPEVPVVPIALQGTREYMTPSIHKLPRVWRKAIITYGQPFTWLAWLAENIELSALQALTDKEDDVVNDELFKLFKSFTSHLMEQIKEQGAP